MSKPMLDDGATITQEPTPDCGTQGHTWVRHYQDPDYIRSGMERCYICGAYRETEDKPPGKADAYQQEAI